MPDLNGAAGEFWLPIPPTDRLHGRYHIVESGGVEVEIFGPFDGEDANLLNGLPAANIPVLRGKVGDNLAGGTEVTLLDLVPVLTSSRMRRFTANRAIEGAAFDSVGAIQLTVASIKLEFLDEWVDRAAGSRATEEIGEDYVSVHRAADHEDLVATVPGAEIRLKTVSSEFVSHPEIAFRVSSELVVTSDEAMGLDDLYFRFLRPLRDLLSLATSEVVRIQSHSIGVPGREAVRHPHHGKCTHTPRPPFRLRGPGT